MDTTLKRSPVATVTGCTLYRDMIRTLAHADSVATKRSFFSVRRICFALGQSFIANGRVSVAIVCLFVLCTAGRTATAQQTEPPPSQPSSTAWALPSIKSVEQSKTSIETSMNAITDNRDVLKAEWRRVLASLDRQLLVLREIEAGQAPPTVAAFADGPLTVQAYDSLLDRVASATTQTEIASARLSDAKEAIDMLSSRFDAMERDRRQAAEKAESAASNTDPAVVTEAQHALELATAQSRSAAAARDLARIERVRDERLLTRATENAKALTQEAAIARDRVRFAMAELDEMMLALDRQDQRLASQRVASQSIEYADQRWLDARRRYDDAGGNDPVIAAEVEAQRASRTLYERQAALASAAIERVARMRLAWQIRFAVLNNLATDEQQRDGLSELKQLASDITRDIRLQSSRRDELTTQATSLETGLENADANEARWKRTHARTLRQHVDTINASLASLRADASIVDRTIGRLTDERARISLAERVGAIWRGIVGAWTAELFVVDDRAITVGKLIVGVVLLALGYWIAKLLSLAVGNVLLKRFGVNEGARAVARSVLFYLLLFTVILFALRLINVPLTVFTVLGGALAIGVGFGSQNLMSNFISGLLLLAERPIRVGDLVQIGDLHGTIEHIGARSTHVKTPSNIELIVPNSKFLEDVVTNWTRNNDQIRTSITVGVSYGSNTRDVAKLLKRAAEEHGLVLKKPAPVVLFTDFGDNSLVFELVFWVRMKKMMQKRQVESDLRFQIDNILDEAGIVIAFPQRDVHLDATRPLDIRVRRFVASESDAD